ncbi:unnamed protein product [Didymodactylos carnosus]|uniref:Uncharacterized protein n=1 Tax=Didymodactylos carnosus TaxID=1234261 RepID=A0A8S2KE95_9BILA|nr:unnamed protein product [Didymodactylos carnosus]CAF3850488.1 unnamed protein product [Didymodactylos carnosus]
MTNDDSTSETLTDVSMMQATSSNDMINKQNITPQLSPEMLIRNENDRTSSYWIKDQNNNDNQTHDEQKQQQQQQQVEGINHEIQEEDDNDVGGGQSHTTSNIDEQQQKVDNEDGGTASKFLSLRHKEY